MEWSNLIPQAILAIIAISGSYFVAKMQTDSVREKNATESDRNDSEATGKITEAALSLLEPMQKEINQLRIRQKMADDDVAELTNRVRKLENEIDQWSEGAIRLIKQLESRQIIPVWTPKDIVL